MTSTTSMPTTPATGERTDWLAIARELGPAFAARAAALDANDSFAAENFRELKERRVFSALVPAELGGGGATYPEVCAMMHELGRHCSSTALAVSMHMHLLATVVWQHQHGAPVGPVLEGIAAGELVLVTSGASDWLDSNGAMERVDGGYSVTAHKHFVSGSPGGDLFITSAVAEDGEQGPEVLHFVVPMQAAGVTVLNNWRTLGMRASGSNDVTLENVFVPDEMISARRPRGEWPVVFNVVATLALPPIISAYLGIAEAAREKALMHAASRPDTEGTVYIVGEMENALTTARLAVDAAVALAATLDFEPEVERASKQLAHKTIAAEALTLAVDKAVEVVGGAGFFRSFGLERLVRDMHAVQYHPLPAKRQHRLAGRLALGLDPTA